ncbi:MAG: glycosyltransferase family 4 protein [Methanomassiliicoccaceae archaeon]|jgi:glycosyltransferase involved in cell wall biosynthesis|nr:glycosyltransferase family 4 protein [Methanomassiliicoccaceae archaeon]
MRIVDVNPFFYPYHGGIERRMYDTSKLLAEKGHDVTVLTGRLPGTEEEERMDGFRVIRLRSRFIKIYNPPYISSKGVADALNSLDADIVNYNYRWAGSYNKPLAAYSGKKVFTYHNMWGEGAGSLQAKLSEMNDNRFAKGLRTYDHIICVSDHVRNDLIRRGINEEMTTTVASGITSLPQMRDGEGDFILSLGRLVKTKGLDHLMRAMVDTDQKLVICGRGPESKRLNKLVKKYGIGNRVDIRGWVSEDEKERLMGTCKFFVMPSLFESFGLAAVELMAYGRPVLCTDVNGLPDTVGNAAVIVRPEDPAGLADAINSLSSDEQKRKDLGKNARMRAEGYLWDNHIGSIEDVYRKVVDGTYRSARE